ncbi:amidohydrolase family protein [Colwellia sp. MEBiC06753]
MKLFSWILLYLGCGLSVSAQNIALKDVNLIDVNTLAIKPNQTVVIKDKHIVNVEHSETIDLPENTIVINLEGKYLAPGLIDGHVHHATDPDDFDNRPATLKRLRTLLRGGVTTVRDMGGDIRVLAGLQRDAMLNNIQSPDIYYSVILGGDSFFADPRTISSAKGYQAGTTAWMAAINDDTNLDALMLKALGTGATGIKIYAEITTEQLSAIAKAAKNHGLKVWSHVFIGPAKPSAAINAGVEAISHAPDFAAEIIDDYKAWRRQNVSPNKAQEQASYQAANYSSLFDRMKKQGTILDATLTVFEQRKDKDSNTEKRYHHAVMLTQLANKAGIPISAGTDAFSDNSVQLYHELQLLVDDGKLSPIQAIQAATLNNAKVLGMSETIGSIESGKLANMVIFNNNPTDDIANINSVAHVIKHGQFIYRGADPRLPFSPAKRVGSTLWMSGQIGNFPGTMTLASNDIKGQMHQTMKNIGQVLSEYSLNYSDITKCTLMLADIKDWAAASQVYKTYFSSALPTRSAFAASGLALNARVEVECTASY